MRKSYLEARQTGLSFRGPEQTSSTTAFRKDTLNTGSTLPPQSVVASPRLSSSSLNEGGGRQRLDAMERLDWLVQRASNSNCPVLIRGETGTGKERIAEALHLRGPRADAPMIAVNCAALPEALAESLLFGHEKGAFTGAESHRAGFFEAARGGTLFLDEVGELPLRQQASLLRAVENRRAMRIGAVRETKFDARVVAATNRDLEAAVACATFRADLLYRLSTISLRVPPLRERRGELADLAAELLEELRRDSAGPTVALTRAAIDTLQAYDWPGNIRELRNVLEQARLICQSNFIDAEDIAALLGETAPNGVGSTGSNALCMSAVNPGTGAAELDFRGQVRAFEARLITDALISCGGNQTAAARLLRIPLRTLAYKLRSAGHQYGSA